MKKQPVVLTIENIQRATAQEFHFIWSDLRCDKSYDALGVARHIGMYLCRQKLSLSLPQIGRAFRRDHTSVLSAVRKVEQLLKRKARVQFPSAIGPNALVSDHLKSIEGRLTAEHLEAERESDRQLAHIFANWPPTKDTVFPWENKSKTASLARPRGEDREKVGEATGAQPLARPRFDESERVDRLTEQLSAQLREVIRASLTAAVQAALATMREGMCPAVERALRPDADTRNAGGNQATGRRPARPRRPLKG